MPYFYFHARAGGCLIEDLDGGDLPDLDTARAMAVLALRQYVAIAAGAGLRLGPEKDRRMEITDERGQLLSVVRIGDPIGRH